MGFHQIRKMHLSTRGYVYCMIVYTEKKKASSEFYNPGWVVVNMAEQIYLNLTFAFVGLKASFVKILSSSHKLSYDVAKAVRKNENAILRICLCCCGSAHRIKVLTPKMLPLLLWTQKKTWIEFCNFWSCVFKYSSKTRIEFYNYSLRGSHQSRKKNY